MRDPVKVDPTDPEHFGAWLDAVIKLKQELHALALDATARKGQRRHARGYLRAQMTKRLRALSAALAEVDHQRRPLAGFPSDPNPTK